MVRHPQQLNDLARMLTYIFCHRPDEFGLVLAEDGSVGVRQLLQALTSEPGWGYVRRRHLEEVAALLQPPSFELLGERFRSLAPPAQLRRIPEDPLPPLLYLGLPPKAHALVWEEGLKAPRGQELLLASRVELALKLARRRTPSPILVTVQAQAAARRGIIFHAYGEELYLTQKIPREFLQLPAPALPKEKTRQPPAAPPPPPGALQLDLTQILQGGTPVAPEKAARAKRFHQRHGKKDYKSSKKHPGR